MRVAFLISIAVMLSACAVTMTDKAAKIQVHSQMSTLLNSCKQLGPVSENGKDLLMGVSHALAAARVKARERVADMGGDTLVVTNVDTFGSTEATVQGTALKCY